MTYSYILSGCRTPHGKFLGALASLTAPQLGAKAIAEAIQRAGVMPNEIDEVIMGNVLSAGLGQAPARQGALQAGLPPTVPAVTINKVCGSGLKAVMLADQAIRAGDARLIVAGGMESMSRAPYLVEGARQGWRFGDQKVSDSMLHDGLWCAFEDLPMGAEADYIASSRNVSRTDQDAFAVESHRRAVGSSNHLSTEIVPVTIALSKGDPAIIASDEGPRADCNLAALARLKPAFGEQGTVTAGNASQISDGAAALVVASEDIAQGSNLPLKARIIATAVTGVAPKELFIAPVSAIERVLAKANLTLSDIDLVELNEAFAAQCLACMRPLGLNHDKTNVHGGAIALGHPIGASRRASVGYAIACSGRRNAGRGLAALCLGGGNAVAMIIERV